MVVDTADVSIPNTPTQHFAILPKTPDIRFSPSDQVTRAEISSKSSGLRVTPVRKERARKGLGRHFEEGLLQSIKDTLDQVLAENVDLRATIDRNEAASLQRHQVLLETVRALELANVTANVGPNIVQRSNFEEPKWPLSTSEQVVDFNNKLKDASFRDQLVIKEIE